jgi:hypothetical protein
MAMRPTPSSRPAGLTLAAVRVAWLVERLSRRVSRGLFSAPRPPLPRHHFTNEVRTIDLQTPLRAARKPPREVVFIPEDEYFREVERVLESV